MLTLKYRLILVFLFMSFMSLAQTAWTWTPLSNMPFKISNNAVTAAEIGGNKYIYSFGGIDSTKIWSGINNKAFKYDVSNDMWSSIDSLPLDLPVIAAAASTVKNMIYFIGGYHVYSNGNEASSNKVIIYDPVTDAYLANGADIPVSIDDQAQCVYKDSLIYVISGWSNVGNTNTVQIYDPELDQWTTGTSVPIGINYQVFGSSAYIIGDTIYYHGGASMQTNFPAKATLRKGIIDPLDPTQITWTLEDDALSPNYRSACVAHGNNVFWIGGSSTSYNYNGIAYNGSGGVPPSYTIARFDALTKTWYEGSGSPYGVMDLRGAGQISNTEWIICGGMENGQVVSEKTYKLTYDPVTGGLHQNVSDNKPYFWQNGNQLNFEKEVSDIILFSVDGRVIQNIDNQTLNPVPEGLYILEYAISGSTYRDLFFLKSF